MTSFHSSLGMLLLAGLMLAFSARCLGLPLPVRLRRARRILLPLLLASALPGLAAAQAMNRQGHPPGMGGNGHMPPPGPPPEAVTACSGKARGAACSFTGRRGDTRTGICGLAQAAPGGGSTASTTETGTLACGMGGVGTLGAPSPPGGMPPSRS